MWIGKKETVRLLLLPGRLPSTPLRCTLCIISNQNEKKNLTLNAVDALNPDACTRKRKAINSLTHLLQHHIPHPRRAQSQEHKTDCRTEVSPSQRSCRYLGALPKLIRGALVRSRRAFAVLHDPGVSFHVLEGDSLLGIQDEELLKGQYT